MSPGGKVSSIGGELRTNGIMLSPDEKTLYITNGAVVVALDVQPDGSVTNRRDFAKLEAGGAGDGMAIDAAGRLYVTSGPGIQIFNPQGKYLGLIPTPRPVISAAFSGPDKKTLYVVGSRRARPRWERIPNASGRPQQREDHIQNPHAGPGVQGSWEVALTDRARIFHVDAFTDQLFAGNPAAVCLLTEERSADWMQSIAAEMNLSETAFVRKLEEGYELRWFTPTVEVDLCGHATLASAHILWSHGFMVTMNRFGFTPGAES